MRTMHLVTCSAGDVDTGVGAADGDVVHSSCVAEGDDAVFADLVVPDSVVGVVVAAGSGGGFGECVVAARGSARETPCQIESRVRGSESIKARRPLTLDLS